MAHSPRVKFGIVWTTVVMAGFVLGAVLGPPDAVIQAGIALAVIPFGALVAYLLVYRTSVFSSDAAVTEWLS